ncbi:MAG TPA: DUF1987 domain-containing protein [Bacteroidales bacterium]|nr:DUF1987 domain-containing protein [Bacteroidales bacterium]HOK75302.1 DUF1987 domain-containing protein [Bacteroidales bacterium]HOM40786.1 DUF1987 domain-containing protein [Bacteroidales bacterium]HOU29792.1 DUF1987 domain-containing protein [Bacteroidales bacterium]HPP92457.1 DUF1987 domain-containing protein [Bacteroidales bacterium]
MGELRIEKGKNTPEIILDPEGVIQITGRSIHENAEEFYQPVEEWINEYIKNPADITVVNIHMEYFNSASARVFIKLFQKIIYVTVKDKKYIFNWYYDEGDEDILERGEYFSAVLSVPFNFIELKGK